MTRGPTCSVGVSSGRSPRDDTYVQLLVDEGRITAEEANTHPQKSLLTRALDGRDVEPEYSVRQAVAGDRYLICSDGLSGVVSDETIAETLREYADLSQCAERLVQLALRGGGPDNITVIVADVTDEDIIEESPVVGGAAANDRGMQSSADASTPAARASALAQAQDAAATPDRLPPEVTAAARATNRPRRHPLRTALVLTVLTALLGTGMWFGWSYTQSRYYVGVTGDGKIAVFQGIPGEIAGVKLSEVDTLSAATIDELTPVAQQKVREGIPAPNQEEARQQLNDLLDPQSKNLLPFCSVPTTATPSPQATAQPAPSPHVVPSVPPTGARPSATPTAIPDLTLPSGPPDCRPVTR